MSLQPVAQPRQRTGSGDGVAPGFQHLPPQGGETHPFGEALAIHLTPQHTQLDQPDQIVFRARGAEAAAAEAGPVVAAGQLAAAEGALLERAVETQPERQAADGLARAPEGVLGSAGGGDHAAAASAGILGPSLCPLRPMLLLASASPARRRLLEQAGIPHRVRVSGVDEEAITHPDPVQLVQLLARAKAEAVRDVVAEAVSDAQDGECPLTAVLGCDSVLVFDREVFGKPQDPAEAIARWRRMAGGWGELHTGHCLLDLEASASAGVACGQDQRLATVTTRVQFSAIGEAAIAAYVASGEPLQCAGGFALEGRGGALVERIEGCVSNVIGLSLPLLRRWLEPMLTAPGGR